MSPELIQFPEPKRNFDAPELDTLQERLILSENIDTLTNMWRYASHRPAATPIAIAELIVDHSKPPEDGPVDYMKATGFGGKFTYENAEYMTRYQDARIAVSKWTHNERLDTVTVKDKAFIRGLDRMIEYVKNCNDLGENQEMVQEALRVLYRLYVLREQIAPKIGKGSSIETIAYRELAEKIALIF